MFNAPELGDQGGREAAASLIDIHAPGSFARRTPVTETGAGITIDEINQTGTEDTMPTL
jgi:hypothetical protein